HRPCLHRARSDAAVAAHPARHAGAGRERARRPRRDGLHHRRSGALHRHCGARHLGGAFERRQRSADHVAGLFAVHHALCGARAGAWRQPRKRHQSRVRGSPARRSRQLSRRGEAVARRAPARTREPIRHADGELPARRAPGRRDAHRARAQGPRAAQEGAQAGAEGHRHAVPRPR
ncbi:hypothetical protein KXW38_001169, partial [Aspergillus fumigatus]